DEKAAQKENVQPLFWRLYPIDHKAVDPTVHGAARWNKLQADKNAAEAEEAKSALPPESAMSGALAGLEFLQRGGASEPSSASAAPAAASGSQKRKQPGEAPPPVAPAVAASDQGVDFAKLSIKELKQRIQAAGIQLPPGAAEKSDLVGALQNARNANAGEGTTFL
ncbi:unnamed protein product, partial [Polarella glacialis]